MDVPRLPSPDPLALRSVPEISSKTVIDLVTDMNRVGFGVLSSYLEPADLEDIRQFVETAVAAAGGEYVVFTGEETVAGTLLVSCPTHPLSRTCCTKSTSKAPVARRRTNHSIRSCAA